MRTIRPSQLSAAALASVLLAGCGISDPYKASSHSTSSPTTSPPTASTPATMGSAGESPAPPPPTPASQTPASVQPTQQQAIAQFARLYTNWTWRTLTAQQHRLAQISVGAARLAEQQAAAASSGDAIISRGQITNQGSLVSAAPSLTSPGEWVVVTHEQTGGNSQYDGLQASWHVTLAEVVKVAAGYVIGRWQPQS
jgi:type IV secretory pathway VirB10-like protein